MPFWSFERQKNTKQYKDILSFESPIRAGAPTQHTLQYHDSHRILALLLREQELLIITVA